MRRTAAARWSRPRRAKARQDEQGERDDEEDVLETLRQVHAQEDLVVPDEAGLGQRFHRILTRR